MIIVSFNTCTLLRDCLAALTTALEGFTPPPRLLVVDNGSQDGSPGMVQRDFPQVTLLQPSQNLGFAAGNNLALRALGFGPGRQGEVDAVWLLNPDTVVGAEAPVRLLAALESAPDVGAVGPRLLYGDGGFQHGAVAFPGLIQAAFDLFPLPARLYESRLNGRYPRSLWNGTAPFEVDMLLGAALLVRGATIDEIGLLDERYYMYMEEPDWCRAMAAAGWRRLAVPGARVVHFGGQSTGQVREKMVVALWRARLAYTRKWHGAGRVAALRLLLRLARAGDRLVARRGRDEAARQRAAALGKVLAS